MGIAGDIGDGLPTLNRPLMDDDPRLPALPRDDNLNSEIRAASSTRETWDPPEDRRVIVICPPCNMFAPGPGVPGPFPPFGRVCSRDGDTANPA